MSVLCLLFLYFSSMGQCWFIFMKVKAQYFAMKTHKGLSLRNLKLIWIEVLDTGMNMKVCEDFMVRVKLYTKKITRYKRVRGWNLKNSCEEILRWQVIPTLFIECNYSHSLVLNQLSPHYKVASDIFLIFFAFVLLAMPHGNLLFWYQIGLPAFNVIWRHLGAESHLKKKINFNSDCVKRLQS